MYCDGVECPNRPCPLSCKSSAKAIHIEFNGGIKGKIALKLFSKYPHLRKNKMWGNHFWQRGYFVDSVGINEEIIRRYVRYQEKVEKQEQAQLALD